ncbi:MAG: hypothetical protein ACI8QC_000635 [Planctomycetota bacterium]|jgi:hypothetical protein
MGWLRYILPIVLAAPLHAQEPPHTPLDKTRPLGMLARTLGSRSTLIGALGDWGDRQGPWRLGLVFRYGECQSLGAFGNRLPLRNDGEPEDPFHFQATIRIPELGAQLGPKLAEALRSKMKAQLDPLRLALMSMSSIESTGALKTSGMELIYLEGWIEKARTSKEANLWTAAKHLLTGKQTRTWRDQDLVLTASKSKTSVSLIARMPKFKASVYLVSGDLKDAPELERVALELFSILLKKELPPVQAPAEDK